MQTQPTPVYTERLWVPFSYWAIGLFFGLTFVTAASFMLGNLILWTATTATVLGIAWTLVAWGSLRIRVDRSGLRVGHSMLTWRYLGEVAVLDSDQRRRRGAAGPVENVFLVMRPYIATAVEVAVEDPADPHPSWLISTRRPAQLAAALATHRPIIVDDPAGPAPVDSGG